MRLGDLLGLTSRPATTLYHGDCLELMRSLPAASVDAVVTDPPYGLRFMSKRWDYTVPSVAMWAEALRVLKDGGRLLSFGGTRTFHRIWVNIEDAGFTIEDTIAWLYGSGFPKHRSKLKPAMEPICIARKGDASDLNIDACRVGNEQRTYKGAGKSDKVYNASRAGMHDGRGSELQYLVNGRWPANVMFDEDATGLLPEGIARYFYVAKASRAEREFGLDDMPTHPGGSNAKGFTEDVANGHDRNKPVKNPHPTVKPIALMRELIKLVTVEGEVVLDPFMGSGTTGIAAKLEERNFIGMELDPDNVGMVEIARRRIDAWQ